MDVNVTNNGSNTIRVIIDGDTVDDKQLAPGESIEIHTRDQGTVSLREMGA